MRVQKRIEYLFNDLILLVLLLDLSERILSITTK
jgi:hypothetical protein